ncbi:MAG: septation protein A [Alphaproteobacteria bacterium]|nr:septation protein A [Alphaproteobacteria bacterium]
MSDERKPPAWVAPTADYGPLVLFFAAYWLSGLMAATAVIVVTSLMALAITWFYERRVPIMPLVTAGVVSLFGGLTLWLQDETFIKMKPTIVQTIFAAVLLGGLAFGRPLLKPLLGKMMPPMSDAGWKGLTLRYGLFFIVMAALNELVWRTQSTDFWVNFKVFGIMALTIGFIMLQMPFMNRHMVETSTSDDSPTRDAKEPL